MCVLRRFWFGVVLFFGIARCVWFNYLWDNTKTFYIFAPFQ